MVFMNSRFDLYKQKFNKNEKENLKEEIYFQTLKNDK